MVVHPALNGAPEGPGAELWIEALLGQECHRLVGELDRYVLGLEAPLGALQQQPGDVRRLLPGQGAEDDHLVYAVDELRPEAPLEDLLHVLLEFVKGLVAAGGGRGPPGPRGAGA